MKIHNVSQGSPEWHALRAQHFNASEAPVMMGASKYQTRTALLTLKKTGIVPEVDSSQQYRFDLGHKTEALARPIVERMIGEDLFPIVGTEGNLLASVDGATMLVETLFEHKLWNESVVAQVQAGELLPQYYWQLEQQLLVTGAERVIFVCSDGTEDNFVSMEYRPIPGRAEQLIAGWKQFESDLVDFAPPATVVEVVGKPPTRLPALHIEVTGMVTASNLMAIKEAALETINQISTQLETDQDFATAESTMKWCSDVESSLSDAKQRALSQTESIAELFSMIDELAAETRSKRLQLEKLVKARKVSIRQDIVIEAAKGLLTHVDQINVTLGGNVRMPTVPANFAEVIKNKRSIASVRDAVDSELARAKIAASQIADNMRINLESLRTLTADHAFLFEDVAQLVGKANDDLIAVIKARIAGYKEQEERKKTDQLEAERLRDQAASTASTPVPARAHATPQIAKQALTKPTAQAAVHTAYQPEVYDLQALIKAVGDGKAPLNIITIDWHVLDALAAKSGTGFALPGVKMAPVAA